MGLTIIDSRHIFQADVIGNVRSAQEDSHDIAALTPNGDVFVVCDGMGGHVGGKQASSIAVKCIIDHLKKDRYPDPIQALNDALQFANMQILGYAAEHPDLKGMGTTACVVLMQDTKAYIAHVGDSRIYLYMGKEKELHRVTKDHSYVQTLVDAGQITDEEAEHHPNKNRILKALGIKPGLSPSINTIIPKNGDVFLICSDGLSGMISDATINKVLDKNIPISEKGAVLIKLALDAGGDDNITVELIEIANSPHPKSQFMSFNPGANRKRRKTGLMKKYKSLLIALLAVIVCGAIGFGGYKIICSSKYKSELEELNEKISGDSLRLEDLRKMRDNAEHDLSNQQKKVDELKGNYNRDKKSKEGKEAYDSGVASLKLIKEKLDSLNKKFDEIEKRLNSDRDERNKLINKDKRNEGNHNRSEQSK